MRIISGLNKGKKLIMPNNKTTRPLKDMAKESIFNILAHANYINFHLKETISGSYGVDPTPYAMTIYSDPGPLDY